MKHESNPYLVDMPIVPGKVLRRAQLKEIERELEQRRRLVPTGSALPIWAKSGGECRVCGSERPAAKLLVRMPEVNDDGKVTGPKVCRFCSPSISDEVVYRYGFEIDDWDYRWLAHLDSNSQVFNGKVVSVN